MHHNRINLALLFLCISVWTIHGQSGNLVLNPSFEQSIDFDDNTGAWQKCMRNDTPDYLEFSARGEPNFYFREYIGGLLPANGSAYIGIFCYRVHPVRGISNVREAIQVPLKAQLEKDTVYSVSLHVALDPESNTAINNLDVGFAAKTVSFRKEKELYEISPRVHFKRRFYDSITWMKLEKEYKARGTETQLILGNFHEDRTTRTKDVRFKSQMKEKWNLHELEKVAYYYVDMVSVQKLSERQEPDIDPAPIPDQASPPETPVKLEIELSTVVKDSSITLENIYFEFDKAELLPESHEELDFLFEQLQAHPELSITIEGHTDNMGTYEYNMHLSNERASAVVAYLIERGLEEERIRAEGYGYTRPLSHNRTEEGRQLNRRVAFRVVQSEQENAPHE